MNQLVALAKAKRYPEMEILSTELAVAHAQSGFVWKALSVAQQMQGKDALQALETAARLLPQDPESHSNLGAALRQRGRAEDAIASHRRALEIRPDLAEVWNNLGHALHDIGNLGDAVTSFRRALQLRPDFVNPLNNLGNALKDLGQIDAAVESYRQALRVDPTCLEAHVNLGSILRLQNRPADALESCRLALKIDAQFLSAILLLADLEADGGRFVDAEVAYRRANALQPNSPEAWAGLAGLKRMTAADGQWLMEASRILAGPLPAQREMPLRYAVGKYCDDVGDHEEAFANYRRANELARSARPRHDRRQVIHAIDRIIQIYDRQWLNGIRVEAVTNVHVNASANTNTDTHANTNAYGSDRRNGNGDPPTSERAVFIVGMPRSGTTLAEQILASHGAVFGGGELPFWNTAVAHPAVTSCEAIESWRLTVLAEQYLALLSELSTDARRVVDKMPGNFLYLGLIHAALPKARFIHLRRNPLDTCLSIYFQNFGAEHSYAHDLDDLAHYYAEYLRIMEHWRQLLPPVVFLEVNYEDLVAVPQLISRKMVDFIGLPWDSRCLEFQRNSRTVSTFSKWQVRQAINPASIGRWRRYERFIAPLRALG